MKPLIPSSFFALWVGCSLLSTSAAQAQLLVTTHIPMRVHAFAEGAKGDVPPLSTLQSTDFAGQPTTDPVHGELFLPGLAGNAVYTYALGAAGDAPPLRSIFGPATGLHEPHGVAVDLVHGELVVANFADGFGGSITVYPRTASGNAAPLRKIEGTATGLVWTVAVAVDPVADEIFVLCQGEASDDDEASASIRVFPRTGVGNISPKRIIQGAKTRLGLPPAHMLLDLAHDELLVTAFKGAVRAYARGAQGNVAPLREIKGAKTGLSNTYGIGLLGDSELVVADRAQSQPGDDGSVLVFARTANGNVAPRRRISGPTTKLGDPAGVAVGRRALLVGGGRFSVEATWRTSAGEIGGAQPVPLTGDTGYLWFFGPTNVEVVLKVIDACALNDRYWVFAAGLTNTDVELKVTDLATGRVKAYKNPQNKPFQPILDTNAFATCGAKKSGGMRSAVLAAREANGAMAGVPPRSPWPVANAAMVTALFDALCTGLCLENDRFQVSATWRTGDGTTGSAHGVEITADTGYQWFFEPQNVEVVIKVLDACGVNGHHWVFAAGLTDVQVELAVRDTKTGAVKTYVNPQGKPFQPIQDTAAFATCP